MRGYKTSKDYKRLKELLDKGREVIVISDQTVTATAIAVMANPCTYVFRGNLPIAYAYDTHFEAACTFYNIEFIEPTEE